MTLPQAALLSPHLGVHVPPEAGAPGPDGRGEPQQKPAVLPVDFGRLLGFSQEGFGVVRTAGDHQGHRVLDKQPATKEWCKGLSQSD